jgi:uncharacterized membrane protein
MAPVLLFAYAMVALGLGLSAWVEWKTIENDIGRMNTVFKFYLHVWIVWGIVGAWALWYLFGVVRPQERFLRRMSDLGASLVVAPRFAFGAVAIVLLALALVYPYFGTRARLHDRFDPAQGSGNNGMGYMSNPKTAYNDFEPRTGLGGPTDFRATRDAVTWMRENIEGSPTIIEAVAPLYHYTSRVSIMTGLPTVTGWDWHQRQQRARFSTRVDERQREVVEFYRTGDAGLARDILRKYDVQWVVVGDVERNYYPEEGIAKFNDGLGGVLELAYSNASFQLWHVIPRDELAQAASQ